MKKFKRNIFSTDTFVMIFCVSIILVSIASVVVGVALRVYIIQFIISLMK